MVRSFIKSYNPHVCHASSLNCRNIVSHTGFFFFGEFFFFLVRKENQMHTVCQLVHWHHQCSGSLEDNHVVKSDIAEFYPVEAMVQFLEQTRPLQQFAESFHKQRVQLRDDAMNGLGVVKGVHKMKFKARQKIGQKSMCGCNSGNYSAYVLY